MNIPTLIYWLRPYVGINALIALAFLLSASALWVVTYARVTVWRGQWLRIAQGFLLLAVLLPLTALFIPRTLLLSHSSQVWSGISQSSRHINLLLASKVTSPEGSFSGLHGVMNTDNALVAIAVTLSFGIFASLLLLVIRLSKLHYFLKRQPCLKRIGKTRILVSHEAEIPFSCRSLGRAYVVLPIQYVLDPKNCRLALHHEIQHHRQGDTSWTYLLEIIRACCFWNPAMHAFAKIISQLQEFACDEVLVGHRNVSAQDYGRCLFQAAQSAVGSRNLFVGTTSMAAGTHGSLLKRRIELMLTLKERRVKKWPAVLFAAGTVTLMASVAFASASAFQDRKLTKEEAQRLALKMTEDGGIPITVNEMVLDRLNLYIGTPEGRQSVREGIARMPAYQTMIEAKLAEYGLPKELLAVPLEESRYKNLLQGPHTRSAGIWQFIPQTARRYDLEIDSDVDERLIPEKETVAAMEYLRDLNNIFQDWRLAIKAYNEGEQHVMRAIVENGTRDPWILEQAESPEHYLSSVMAMMIILKNPSLIH